MASPSLMFFIFKQADKGVKKQFSQVIKIPLSGMMLLSVT